MHERVERVKTHLKENKKVYIVGAGCLVAGYILHGHSPLVLNTAKNTALLQWKPTATNIAVTTLERRGHPGYMIKNVTTGEVFASIRRAAEAANVSRRVIQKHLQGELPDAGGYIFENLGEMR